MKQIEIYNRTDEQICTDIRKAVFATNARQDKIEVFFDYASHINSLLVYSFTKDTYSEILWHKTLNLNYRCTTRAEIFHKDFKSTLAEIHNYLNNL